MQLGSREKLTKTVCNFGKHTKSRTPSYYYPSDIIERRLEFFESFSCNVVSAIYSEITFRAFIPYLAGDRRDFTYIIYTGMTSSDGKSDFLESLPRKERKPSYSHSYGTKVTFICIIKLTKWLWWKLPKYPWYLTSLDIFCSRNFYFFFWFLFFWFSLVPRPSFSNSNSPKTLSSHFFPIPNLSIVQVYLITPECSPLPKL